MRFFLPLLACSGYVAGATGQTTCTATTTSGCTLRSSGSTCTFDGATGETARCFQESLASNANAGFVIGPDGTLVFVPDADVRTSAPSPAPTTADPTAAPTPAPTPSPTTASPTPPPVTDPTAAPTPSPTTDPTPSPTSDPTTPPTPDPTEAPIEYETLVMTVCDTCDLALMTSDEKKTLEAEVQRETLESSSGNLVEADITGVVLNARAASRTRRAGTGIDATIEFAPTIDTEKVGKAKAAIDTAIKDGDVEMVGITQGGEAITVVVSAATSQKTPVPTLPPPPPDPCDFVDAPDGCVCDRETSEFVPGPGNTLDRIFTFFAKEGEVCVVTAAGGTVATQNTGNSVSTNLTDQGVCLDTCCCPSTQTCSLSGTVTNCAEAKEQGNPNQNCEARTDVSFASQTCTFETPAEEDCKDDSAVIIIVCIFGILVLFVICVSLYFCISSKEPTNLTTPDEQKY